MVGAVESEAAEPPGDLEMRAFIVNGHFAGIQVDRFAMEWVPRTHGTMYRGVATK